MGSLQQFVHNKAATQQITRSPLDLEATLVYESTPLGTNVTPSRLQVDDFYIKRLEANWATNNRLSTSSRLLAWHSVYLRLL